MTFSEELRAAMDTPDPEAYISRVKTVVNRQLLSIDGSAVIQDTRYFNHSSIPDFVLSWAGQKRERRVYLRDSYGAMLAGHDDDYLIEGDPVLVSLSGSEVESPVPFKLDATDRTLVTDAAAVEVISDSALAEATPLARMVKANFLRGARGEINRPRAETLVHSADEKRPGTAALGSVAEVLSRNFFDDAAFQINRTAILIETAFREVEEVDLEEDVLSGQLSVAELQTVLPWLIQQERAIANRSFWQRISGLITLADLEKAKDSLQDLDLSPLVEAAADVWEARWAYLGLSLPVPTASSADERSEYWSFVRGTLGIDRGALRVSVASTGRSLPKQRGGRSTPPWEVVRPRLVGERLSRIELLGVRRSISISAEQSPDVRADVEDVTKSLNDKYFVTRVTLQVPSTPNIESDASVVIDFSSAIATASAGVSIGTLYQLTTRIVAGALPQE